MQRAQGKLKSIAPVKTCHDRHAHVPFCTSKQRSVAVHEWTSCTLNSESLAKNTESSLNCVDRAVFKVVSPSVSPVFPFRKFGS